MAKHILINEAELPILIDFYKSRIEAKERELMVLKETLVSLQDNSSNVIPDMNTMNTSILDNGYNPVWTWVKKIDFILGDSKLTTSDIVSTVLTYEPSLKESRSKIVGSISAVLSAKSKGNKYYTKEQNQRGEFIYGLLSKTKVETNNKLNTEADIIDNDSFLL